MKFNLLKSKLFNRKKQLSWPMKLGDAIDVMFSHNSVISLWFQHPNDQNGCYICFYENQMGWSIPDHYKDMLITQVLGLIPENNFNADTINLLIDPTTCPQQYEILVKKYEYRTEGGSEEC